MLLKLCSNVPMRTFTQSLFEMARLAEQRGVDVEALVDFVHGSAMGSDYGDFKAQFLAVQTVLVTHLRELMQCALDDCLSAARAVDARAPLSEVERRLI